MKHLFLEGPIQTGKSTLIREALKPYTGSAPAFNASNISIGGFACQRLKVNGITKAFRIGPAQTTDLTAPLEKFAAGHDLSSLAGKNGIFKVFAEERTIMDNEVFALDAASYMKDTYGRDLMLLDEIGGQELTNEPFMEALIKLLSGDVPCLGVLKRAEDASRIDPELLQLNNELRRRILEEFDGQILYYERGDESVRKAVREFLASVF